MPHTVRQFEVPPELHHRERPASTTSAPSSGHTPLHHKEIMEDCRRWHLKVRPDVLRMFSRECLPNLDDFRAGPLLPHQWAGLA
ncbi:zinc finger protein 536 isoform X1 [Lates japonicus]|uniref:Zinc finger protein 536 isoform X1 n=1 Tax=Lates japonicus TaxID=270547 RepID=A0AAD3NHE1_LATJO|nr:zinc finger protein 536 isoform X1 [Lates japonicus]